jgi:hypothetical protein
MIVRIGVAGAGALLAVGLFAAQPAGAENGPGHGTTNGSDTSCFTAGGPQGKSHSDPDGMSNGGADKPGCPGGFDADKDGNNGCGNDADREDDNNGNCGGKGAKDKDVAAPTTTSTSTTTTTTTNTAAVPGTDTDATVAGAGTAVAGTAADGAAAGSTSPAGTSATSGAADTTTTPAVTGAQTQVLGETLEQGPSALARTGAGVGGMALLGGLLCGTGRLAVLARRFLRIG